MLEESNMLWNILKLMLALPVVVLLAYISLRLTNQYLNKTNQRKNIQVIERVPINNKSSLCVVKIGEEYTVMGVSESTFQVIKTLNQDEISDYINQEQGPSFTEAINNNINKWKKGKSKHE